MKARAVRERSNTEAGGTLLELLIAMLILAVGLVPVAQMISSGLSSDLNNRNNSVALVTAQRELEQILQQKMTVAGGGACAGLAGQYYFCDTDGQTVGVGQLGAGNTPTQVGCPLDAAKVQLDFSQPTSACASGYFMTKQVPWNQISNTTITVDLRWRVVAEMNAGSPIRKFIIIGARGRQGGFAVDTNLQSVAGSH